MKQITILIFCIILLKQVSPQDERLITQPDVAKSQNSVGCPTVSSANNPKIQWPSTSNRTLSDPPCTNSSKEFQYRKCENGAWDLEPKCDHIQFKTLPQCPEILIESKELQICYLRSYPQISQFPPKCPFDDLLPFHSYKALVQNLGPFWMPVQRDLRNGLGFMTWIEASPLYGTTFEGNIVYGNSSKGKNCILYHNDSFIEAVSCKEKHSSICAYSYFTQLKSHLCDPRDLCYLSSYNRRKCFCLNTSSSEELYYPEAEFMELYQNNIYANITNETCSIALKKTKNGTYIWSNTQEEIDYTYWSTDVIFDDTHVYGAITPKGWILTEQPASCKLFEKKSKEINPATLSLKIYSNTKFNLSISNYEALEEFSFEILLYCFTNAAALNLTYRYSHIETETNSFEPLEDGPGMYWCKVFTYYYGTLDVVESNEVFLRQQEKFPYEFVGILQLVYKKDIDPLSNEIILFIEREIFSELYEDNNFITRFYNLRIMKVLDVDIPNKTILINIHFTYMRRSFTDNHDQEFKIVKGLIETFVRKRYDLQVTLVEFLSADFCMEETELVRWKRAKIGQTVVSRETCLDIKNNVVNLRRTCEGDFIAGAKWLAVNEACQIFKHSTVTEDILNLLDRKFNNNGISISEIQNISRYYEEFSPLDVYLLGNVTIAILEDNFTISQNEAEQYVEIVGNLLETEKNVLLESQLKFKTMDIFLLYLSEIVWQIYNSGTYFDNQEFCHKSFYVRIISLSERKSYLNSSKHCDRRPQILTANYFNYVDAVNDIELENAIWLKFSSFADHSRDSAIIFAVYNHSPLFGNSPEVIHGPIFKIILRDATPIYTYQKVEDPAHKRCSSWTYQKDFNLSREDHNATTYYYHQYVICEYQFAYNFNLGLRNSKTEFKITESLINLINSSNVPASETINKLRNISEKYDDFTANDLHLTGEILEKLEDSQIDLDDLTTIISNLQEIPQSVLQKSQEEYEATDNILRSIDKIVINHKYTSPVNVTTHNAMTVIYSLKETNFTGLVLKNQENFYSEIIKEQPSIEHLENFESALVLSSELKEQLNDTAVIRMIIFTKNSLFVESISGSRNIPKIFDVLLPEVGDYSGPISVYQRVPKNQYTGKCAYWYYNKTIQGSWIEDHIGKDLSNLIKCDYSHTTHLALLLIDKFSDNLVLEIITHINCVISLVGLVSIFFTALLFEKWRKQFGHKVLLNFVFVMILQTIFFYSSSVVGSSVSADSFWCTITGTALHYFTVSEFYWMVIIGILQYKRYVNILWLPPTHLLLKICLCGYFFPFLHIASVFVLDRNNYKKNLADLCYPSGLGLYLGIWLPIIATAAINLIIFIKIIYSVNQKITKSDHLFKNKEALHLWKLAFVLYFLLGLPWIFGLLGNLDCGLIFVYLFCCTVTLQGFVIFLFFIVIDANTRLLYLQAFGKCASKKS